MASVLTGRCATEAKDWERAIVIIGLNDLADVPNSCLVLVGLVTAVVEGSLVARVTVASCVVDACNEADLPAGTKIVNESGRGENLKLREDE